MKILEQHEQMEMLVLDEMRKIKILDQLIFGGGTMLRLCFDLPRYSVDLDFYLKKGGTTFLPWASRLSTALRQMGAEITDEQEKHFSFLWEIRIRAYPRKLKIEMRKESQQAQESELNIAHSLYSPLQVRLRTLTLKQMWINKVNALAGRKEIRDAFDLEFLSRRGGGDFKSLDQGLLDKLAKALDSFSGQDFKTELSGILEDEERKVVQSNRFGYLKSKINEALSSQ